MNLSSASDIDKITSHIKGLKERNIVLEDALRHIVNVLDTEEPVLVTKTKSKSKSKPKEKKKKAPKGFTWCGKQGNFDAYRCDACQKIPRNVDKHRCFVDKDNKRKRKEEKDKKVTKKTKTKEQTNTEGFTLIYKPGKKSSSIAGSSYQCNNCKNLMGEDNIPLHVCPVVAIIMDDETLHDRSHPKYKGNIEGWTWNSYRHEHSCYQCDACHIVMRHDCIHLHQCPGQQRPTEDIVL